MVEDQGVYLGPQLAALKFCFKTCVAMKFVDDDDDDDDDERSMVAHLKWRI